MSEPKHHTSEDKAYSKMAYLCARKEYCISDIKDRLQKYALETEQVEKVIERLVQEKFIDESRYVRSFVHDRLKFNKWGKVKIEYLLRQKQISQAMIDNVFDEYSEHELNESLHDILQAKWRTIRGNTDYEKQNKLIRFALGRGFEMNKILESIKKLD